MDIFTFTETMVQDLKMKKEDYVNVVALRVYHSIKIISKVGEQWEEINIIIQK